MIDKLESSDYTDYPREAVDNKINFEQLIENVIRLPREKHFQQLLTQCSADKKQNKSKHKSNHHDAKLVDKTQSLSQNCLQFLPQQISGLQRSLDAALKKHDLDINISIHIQSTAEYTACMFSNPIDHSFVLMMSGVMIEHLSSDELLFVMAHELGHFYLKHSQTRLENQLVSANKHVNKKIILQSLSRAQEVSADRFGLLFCQDVSVAVSAILKTVYHGEFSTINMDQEQYIRQVEQLDFPRFYDEQLDEYQPWLLSHPPLPLRIKLLKAFDCSFNRTMNTRFNQNDLLRTQQVNQLCDDALNALEIDDLKPVAEVSNFYQHLLCLYDYLGGTQKGVDKISQLIHQQHQCLINTDNDKKLKGSFDDACQFFINAVSSGRKVRTLRFLWRVYQFDHVYLQPAYFKQSQAKKTADLYDRFLQLTTQLQLSDSVYKQLIGQEK